MACFYPNTVHKTKEGKIIFQSTSKGKEKNSRYKATGLDTIEIPCQQCIGCRLEYSRQWAMRSTHEASMHDNNCFITLTYNPENLPPDGGLIKKDFQDFIKRYRKYLSVKYTNLETRRVNTRYDETPLRYYHCGEYGDRNNRPHYHAIIFGHNFDDWTYLFDSPSGHPIYTSPTLEKIWKYGFVTIGTVTMESAAYVARYVMKKLNGRLAESINPETGLKPYERINNFTGEIISVLPEYSTMSRRPGIAHNYISNFTSDVYPKDYTTIRGMRMRPAKYYDKYLESIDPEMYDDIRQGRIMQGYESPDNTPTRLEARATVKRAQHKQLMRNI